MKEKRMSVSVRIREKRQKEREKIDQMSHDGFYASGTKPFRGILIWYIDHSP